MLCIRNLYLEIPVFALSANFKHAQLLLLFIYSFFMMFIDIDYSPLTELCMCVVCVYV